MSRQSRELKKQHLHSIMYLLIRDVPAAGHHQIQFTFHNVSINSRLSDRGLPGRMYLHSIMYLLIQAAPHRKRSAQEHLHSIMYLLIPGCFQDRWNRLN